MGGEHGSTLIIGVQGSTAVAGCEVQAPDRFNGGGKLSCFELQVGEAVEDLGDTQVPEVALRAHPVVESQSLTQRKALQKRTTWEAGRALELGEEMVLHLFWHAQRRARRCAH